MIDKQPQTNQIAQPQREPRGIRRAVIPARIVRPLRKDRGGCRGAQTVVVYVEPMP